MSHKSCYIKREVLAQANKAQAEVISELRAKLDWYGESESVRVTEERKAREAAEARCADQSALIVEIGAKLNATKLREEGLESALSAKDAELGRLRDALRAFKNNEAHRKSCVQMTGKPCSCGFDHTATLAGAVAKSPAAEPTGSCHYPEAKIIRSMCESCAPLPNPPVDCPVCYWFDDSGRKFSFYAPARKSSPS